MKLHGSRLAAYACGHFWIDFSCSLLLFTWIHDTPYWLMAVLLYNFCAFALQMPIGLLADKLNRNSIVASVGCVLVFAGWICLCVPIPAVLLAGIGNACFHVGGGLDVLNACDKKITPLGLFVSPGGLGIFFGMLLGQAHAVRMWIPLIGLTLFPVLFLLLDIYCNRSLRSQNQPFSLAVTSPDGHTGSAIPALISCFLAVALQSYLDLSLSFPWKVGNLAICAVVAVALGKISGGFLGDRLGMRKATASTIVLSAALLLGSTYAAPGLAAMLFFHCSVPLLFWYGAKLLPQARGFSFGLLKFALFLGYLPLYLGITVPQPVNICFAAGTLLLLLLLLPMLRMRDPA